MVFHKVVMGALLSAVRSRKTSIKDGESSRLWQEDTHKMAQLVLELVRLANASQRFNRLV